MKNIIPLILLILSSINGYSQDKNSVWVFGDSSGINFTNLSNPVPISSGMRGRGSCVSISDSIGNLLLYSFTVESSGAWSTHIYNGTHISVPGADSISGEAWYSELVLLPKPNDTTGKLFKLFSLGTGGPPNPGLFMTIVDMNLNGGLGGLLQENVQIDNLDHADCLTAIQHGNGKDWWLISKKRTLPITTYNRFYIYYISGDTVIPLPDQDFNDMTDGDFQKIIWHPSGNKFMLINTLGYMSEFDFDRCSGIISLSRNIYPEQSSQWNRLFWSGAYSSNGNVFYSARTSFGGNAGDYNYLLQYDLAAANIPLSCDTLDSTFYPIADCGDLRLAPDGKIYYSQAYPHGFPYKDTMYNYVNMNLGVVNNPDVVGNGCNFSPFSFYLGGKRTYYGLPNNPNYSLGPLSGSVCDTLTVSIKEAPEQLSTITVSPNPASHLAYFNAKHIKGDIGILTIVSVSGEVLFQKSLPILNNGFVTSRIDLTNFVNGIYILTFKTDKEILTKKIIVNQ
ncbi:MAG: T9SS type A sorting domain-containing protein [Bacteroidota bacterium]